MLRPRSSAPAALEIGNQLGEYRLVRVLGEGGMGIVFEAVRETDGYTVALKVLRSELVGDDVYRRRLAHEARAASEVRHKHLVPVLGAGEAGGHHYLAMGFVAGRSLRDRISSEGPLELEEIPRLVAGVGAGLDALHAAGLVHRDVKPANIMLAKDGSAMLTDLGLARGRAYTVLTKPGQVMGTLDYIAPELIKGEHASPASDIYALGCTAFECVAGVPPFASKGPFEVAVAHLEESPPDPCAQRPDVPASLSWAVLQALHKDPAKRPPSATAYARGVQVAATQDAS
jgi:serine/threonine protein kinase